MISQHYEHVRDRELGEFRGTGRLFRHIRSGCEIYHIHNDDRENLFAFLLKTVPPDSTGVAHILEHTVLCGSRRFPVKDPFLLLLKGSMYTFLNALTFPDKTVYPASSTVPADLFNLMKVYGDAVFFPLLNEEMFRQEGHRLVVGEDGHLDYSGVVYNEMKGAYSTHDAIAGEMALRSLFPDTAYGHDSGGNPRDIPRLTYEQFVEFHRRYYHPSNARIFLYGDIATEDHLAFLHEEFLGSFSLSDPGAGTPVEVELQERWKEPRSVETTYPSDQDDSSGLSSVTVNWLLTDVGAPGTVLACEALADILLGSSGAPLYQALIESGLGEDLSSPSGLESELRELTFSVGLRGTDVQRREAIEGKIFETLTSLRDNGIDPDVIEGTVRKMAFANRERTGSGFGLRLMRRAARAWLHGGEPEQTMCFADSFAQLRGALESNPRYFEEMIDRLLLANPHRTTLIVRPDREYDAKEQERVSKELSAIEANIGESERASLIEKQRALERIQSEPDDPAAVASIPFLTIADVPSEVEKIPSRLETLPGGGPQLIHELDTGGIIYYDLSFDMAGIDTALLPFAPLFANAITDIGLPGMSYDQVSRKLDLTTGGFSAGVSSTSHAVTGLPRSSFNVRAKALQESAEEGFALVFELLRNADFADHRRIRDLFLEERNDIKSAVVPEGSMFAWTHAASRLSQAAQLRDLFRGVAQLRAIAALDPDQCAERLATTFETLRRQLLEQSRIRVAIAAGDAELPEAREIVSRFVSLLPHGAGGHEAASPSPSSRAAGESGAAARHPVEGLSIPGGVGYVARAFRGSRLGEVAFAHEGVLAHLLRTGFLWERIRMKGGAYGAFALQNGAEGLFAMASYRDPCIAPTLGAFEEALEHYVREPPQWRDVELAVLGMVGGETRPLSPSQKNAVGLNRYLTGVSDTMRQERRDALRSTQPHDVVRAAERLRDLANEESSTCIIASRSALESACGEIPGLEGHISDLPL